VVGPFWSDHRLATAERQDIICSTIQSITRGHHIARPCPGREVQRGKEQGLRLCGMPRPGHHFIVDRPTGPSQPSITTDRARCSYIPSLLCTYIPTYTVVVRISALILSDIAAFRLADARVHSGKGWCGPRVGGCLSGVAPTCASADHNTTTLSARAEEDRTRMA
jgi:hypothetical protein